MNNFITIPNIISILRIYSTIPIVYLIWLGENHYLYALIILIIAYVSDAVDGIIARMFNQVSDWGKILDPLGDKILSTALAITFYQQDVVSIFFPIVVITRDLLISLFSTKMIRNTKTIRQASVVGKIVTLMLFVFYTLSLISLIGMIDPRIITKIEIFIIISVFISGIYYLLIYFKTLGRVENV
ncbi:MAG: CDP-alcohol phosphatidyltransferase family protein [Spirochaetes bacterium]|nr:CDP-alcohol phosphatidyltransferase family protein [Spirochaetota bacterium]